MKESNKEILKSLKNPSTNRYMIKSVCSEVTFIGHKGEFDQPDFAEVHVTMIPYKKIIELKSLKLYFQQFRGFLVSYERLINIIFEDINEVYDPMELKIYMKTNARGGIYSELTVGECKND